MFCRRGLVSADLTVSETSPQVEVEERRSLASECRSRQLHGAGRVLVRGRMGRSRLLRAAVRGRVRGPRRVRGAGPVQVLRRLEWHQLHCARGSHAPLRSRLRDSGATATAGAARSARRLSPRPTARATAGARAPERVGWEVAACEQPTCHPVCEHGTCTRHVHSTRRARQLRVLRGLARRTLRRAVTAYRAVKRMECARSEDVFARARTCVLVFVYHDVYHDISYGIMNHDTT